MSANSRPDQTPEELAAAANDDVASVLSRLPGSGAQDDVSRVMDLYEAAERRYRAAMTTNTPTIGSSASTNS